ncbi:uncharacterized protein LOC100828314 isoform X2 [Brachypodium distachyon]|uniref:TFIIS N-terminal domain-containing protein n=1 Tax=Brachypodium distachyon TaxID=15368 RepID=I1IHL0_BRADI|nr:uncharacterized protein LOC100828314 isoform X2 [Brachypodium distachyon]KQJ86354.1 hypothetical protein BRADI_4g04900v3 [Brachypodium distachyon]|eukprot:XP_010237174.1 uncharacterized protein LOC100828314 isoform X2 [Brachypodium distachyon]
MGYLSMAPSSSSVASSPCSRRTFGCSQSQPSSGLFDRHAILLSHRQRELLNVSVRPKQIQLLVCPAYLRPISARADEPSIIIGKNMLTDAVNKMKRRPKSDYRQQLMDALLMLKKLAADGNNRRAMRRSFGMLSIVMAPVSSDLHRNDHGAWSSLAAASLKLMWLLVDDTSPSQRASIMKHEMSRKEEEITRSMMGILNCDKCDEQLRMLAKKILAQVKKIHSH